VGSLSLLSSVVSLLSSLSRRRPSLSPARSLPSIASYTSLVRLSADFSRLDQLISSATCAGLTVTTLASRGNFVAANTIICHEVRGLHRRGKSLVTASKKRTYSGA